ncbi:MAG: DUF1893 domain-containing protein [Theionarchaea archaeon]|nr:DUF1893 domain-containing protein [Theionarchaea archaeon]
MTDTSDLKYAKEVFRTKGLAFAIVRDNEILSESRERGVAPFLRVVQKKNVRGASLADKVVGKAVAFLSVYAGIASVYTKVISSPAEKVFQEYNIHVEADAVVPMIKNRRGDDQCPIEKMIFTCETPEEAYKVLKEKVE